MGANDLMIPGVIESIAEMRELRHRIHALPELGFEEFQTSDLVAEKLQAWGYEVPSRPWRHRRGRHAAQGHRLEVDRPARRHGRLADPGEHRPPPYASTVPGKMHACGHDGHTATLLAAAKHLASHGQFDGTVRVIFQPAEEGQGGARVMIEDGLFEKFPCDAIFAFHNMPGTPVGKFGLRAGAFMPSSDTVNIKVQGRGGHGSAPHLSVDAVTAAAYIVVALQSIVSRNTDPRQMAVVTVGAIHGGNAPNVIADSVEMRLTVRALSPQVRAQLRDRITEIAHSQAKVLGATAEVDYQWRYPVLHNDAAMTDFARQTVVDWLGEDATGRPTWSNFTGSEDFAFMLEKRPGCYLIIGNGDGEGGCMVHNPGYDFNDAILPIGASYWVKLVQRFLAA